MKKIKFLALIFSYSIILFGSQNIFAQHIFDIITPNNLKGYNYQYGVSIDFGKKLDSVSVKGQLIFMKTSDAIDSLGASIATNNVQGKIAVVYRGGLSLSLKALNAEKSGAIACIIINNSTSTDSIINPDDIFSLSGTDQVNIPVISISANTGLKLRKSILSGEVSAYMGKRLGYFNNDLSLLNINRFDGVIPKKFSQSNDIIQIIGGYIENKGKLTQRDIKLTYKIELNNFEKTSGVILLDSLVGNGVKKTISSSLNLKNYEPGYYKLIYYLTAGQNDEFINDNFMVTNFWITDSLIYSKSKYDENFKPIVKNGNFGYGYPKEETSWCSYLFTDSSYYSGLQLKSIVTSVYPALNTSLVGKEVNVLLFELGESLKLISTGKYSFNNDQGLNIEIPFNENVILIDGKKYLTCINKKAQPDISFGTDNINYTPNLSAGGGNSVNSLILIDSNIYSYNYFTPALTLRFNDCKCNLTQTIYSLPDNKSVSNYFLTNYNVSAGCNQDIRVVSGNSWLSVNQNNLTKSLQINTEANAGTVERVGKIFINGNYITIKQPGTNCKYQISKKIFNCLNDKSANYTVGYVTTSNDCLSTKWIAKSLSSWIQTTSEGYSKDSIIITVSENTSDCPREGYVSIFDSLVLVKQPGKNNNIGCAYRNSNWILQDSKSPFQITGEFLSIKPTSETDVWAVIKNTNIFSRTTNGKIWETGFINPASNYYFSSLSALNKDTAWVSMFNRVSLNQGDLFYTYDGGKNWKKSDSTLFKSSKSFVNFVHFFDSKNGVTMGDPATDKFEIYVTKNGGKNWLPVNSPIVVASEYAILNTYTTVGNIIWFTTTKNRVFKSIDMGQTWNVYQLPNFNLNTFNGTTAIAFKDNLNGIYFSNSLTFQTSDGGENWSFLQKQSGYPWVNLAANLTYAKGNKNLEGRYYAGNYYSVDNGANWVLLDTLVHSALGFWDVATGWTGASNKYPITIPSIYKLNLCNAFPINTKLEIDNNSIKSLQSNASYNWYVCSNDEVILGENQDVYMPVVNENYAVIIQQNGCVDTSECVLFEFVGLDHDSNLISKYIYPNPTTGQVTLVNAPLGNYSIINEIGTVVHQFEVKELVNQTIQLGQFAKGIYFLRSNERANIQEKIILLD